MLATALLVGHYKGYASGDNCLQPEKGPVVFEDQSLQGSLPKVAEVLSENKAPLVNATIWRESVMPRVSSTVVRDQPADLTFLPDGYYPEFEATSVLYEGRRGYRRMTLPVESFEGLEVRRCKDPFGRPYLGSPCIAHDMWCWQEKKKVTYPHRCPLGAGQRNKIWRGFYTDYKHPERAKDLCPKCDRSVFSYFHRCNGYIVLLGLEKRKIVDAIDALRYDRPSLWEVLPSWTEEEESYSFKKRLKDGITKIEGPLGFVQES